MKNNFLLSICLLTLACTGFAQTEKRTTRHWIGGPIAEVYYVKSGTPIKHGNYKSYTGGGNLDAEYNYVNNKKNGVFKEYYAATGRLALSGTFLNDELHGTLTSYHNMSGSPISSVEKYNKGARLEIVSYYPNGKKSLVKSENGPYQEWAENGTKMVDAMRKNDDWDGKYTKWTQSGDLTESGTYVNGKKNGLWLSYFSKNRIAQQKEYNMGHLVLDITHDSDTGDTTSITKYNSKVEIIDMTNFRNKKRVKNALKFNEKTYIVSIYDTTINKISRQYETSTPPFNGDINWHKSTEYYPSGLPKTEQEIIPGKKEMKTTDYYPNGKISQRTDYDNTIYQYTQTGYLLHKIFPQKRGESTKDFEQYDSLGVVVQTGVVENGEIISYRRFVNSELKSTKDKYGVIMTYFSDGTKESERKGASYLQYYPDGALAIRCKKQYCVKYYENGQIEGFGMLNDKMKEDGVWYCYDPKGKLFVQEDGVRQERKISKSDAIDKQNQMKKAGLEF